MIRCAHCKGRHFTVADVYDCAEGEREARNRPHSCEDYDGECCFDLQEELRWEAAAHTSARYEFAYVAGTRHYDMG